MLGTLRDLVAHKAHANASFLKLINQNERVATDPEILDLLHHILIANRFWICTVRGLPFIAEETSPGRSYDSLAEAYGSTHEEEAAWLGSATDADCARILAHPSIPGGHCSVAQAFLQVCMHSHGHRAQIAALLRRHGVVPPQTDFILWLAGRPEGERVGQAVTAENSGDRAGATFRSHRVLPFPPKSVFEAFARPELLARWWGPTGFTNTFEVFDFKPGGRWLFVMHGPDGSHHANDSVFSEVDAPSKLVIQHLSLPRYVLTITLAGHQAGTSIKWVQEFDDAAVAARIRHIVEPANEQNLDRLLSILTGGQA